LWWQIHALHQPINFWSSLWMSDDGTTWLMERKEMARMDEYWIKSLTNLLKYPPAGPDVI
jgi:hypothetical protein